MEICQFIVAGRNHLCNPLLIIIRQGDKLLLQVIKLRPELPLFIFTYLIQVPSCCHSPDGSNDLQLRCAFINGGDPCVTVKPLNGKIFNEACSAMYLYRVIGNTVAPLTADQLHHRSVDVCQPGIDLQIVTFLFC